MVWITLGILVATLIYVGLVAWTLRYIYIQTDELRRNRKREVILAILEELRTPETHP